jgi:hypothetical protein
MGVGGLDGFRCGRCRCRVDSLRLLPLQQDFVAAVAVAVFCCGRCRAGSYDFMSHVSWDHVSCHVIDVMIFLICSCYGWLDGRVSLRPLPDSFDIMLELALSSGHALGLNACGLTRELRTQTCGARAVGVDFHLTNVQTLTSASASLSMVVHGCVTPRCFGHG